MGRERASLLRGPPVKIDFYMGLLLRYTTTQVDFCRHDQLIYACKLQGSLYRKFVL